MIGERVDGRQPTTTGACRMTLCDCHPKKNSKSLSQGQKVECCFVLQQQGSLHYQDAFLFFQIRNLKGEKKWERLFVLYFSKFYSAL
jgi:hypothetical protein